MANAKSRMHVTKTMDPDQPGAIKLASKYGESLVCVRYRKDDIGLVRYTTVELIVDETPVTFKTRQVVGVKIAYDELDLRTKARASGGRWDAQAKLWRLPLPVATELGMIDRVVEVKKEELLPVAMKPSK